MNGDVAAKFVNTLMGGPAIGPFSYIYVDGQRGYRGIEIITPAENVTHKKVTLAKVTAKNDPPESTRAFCHPPPPLILMKQDNTNKFYLLLLLTLVLH